MQLFRPFDNVFVETVANFTAHDPIIPYGVFAVNADGSGFKLGDGINTWSNLTYQGSSAIRNKQVQSNREPANNELLIFCESTDKWIYRLQHCFDTVSNWESNTNVFPTSTLLIETDNITQIPTGRFKIGDGITSFPTLPWFGTDFNLSNFNVGESIEFNGSGWDPVIYLKPNELQAATMPTGLFHRDDGIWAEPTFPTTMESITADYASFGTVYVGGFPTEATTVTLTSDGTDLFSDGNKIWTEYNDGAGSGLDADTLDGHHSTAFATGPVSATEGNLVAFGASSNILVDSGVNLTGLATTTYVDETFPTVPSTTVVGNIVTFNSTDGLELADSGSSVSDFATTDHTHAIATATTSGFLPILENTTTKYLRDDGTWQTVTGTSAGDVTGPATSVIGNIVTFNSTDGKSISDSGYDVSDFATTDHTHAIYVTEDDALAYSIAFGG